MQVKNKSCIRRLSFRSLWASRKRNAVAVIAIILTAMLFSAFFTIVFSVNSSFQTYTFRQMGGYCHGTFKDITKEQAEAISGHRKISQSGIRTVIGFIEDGAFAKKPAEISFMDENTAKWSYSEPEVGRLPMQADEVAMDTKALELLGVSPEIGSEVTLSYDIKSDGGDAIKKTDKFRLAGYWQNDDIMPVYYINISEAYAEKIEDLITKKA